jgi:hypothetical protein
MLVRHVLRELLERPVTARTDASLGALRDLGRVALVAVGAAALVLGALFRLSPAFHARWCP